MFSFIARPFAALIFASLATAAFAGEVAEENTVTGYVDMKSGLVYSTVDFDGIALDPFLDASAFLMGFDIAVNAWVMPNAAVQVDLNVMSAGPQTLISGHDAKASSVSGAVHLAYRDPDSYAIGVFGAAQKAGYLFPTLLSGNLQTNAVLGVEGQMYFDDLTLYLQGGVALQSENPNYDPEGVFVPPAWRFYGDYLFIRGVARYFLTDNFQVSAELAYAHGNVTHYQLDPTPTPPVYISGEASSDIVLGKLGAEFRPDGGMATLFASYEASYHRQELGSSVGESLDHKVMGGIRFDFGADSLKTRDREGATFDVPNFSSAIMQGDDIYGFCIDC